MSTGEVLTIGRDHFTAAANAELIITREGSSVRQLKLDGRRTTIGRGPGNRLQISSRYVSWRHAVIDFDTDGAYIVDLCSKNRTLVNDEPIERCNLHDGDVISLGFHRIHFVDNENRRRTASRPKSRVDTKPDVFRTFADSLDEDPEIVALDTETLSIRDAKLDDFDDLLASSDDPVQELVDEPGINRDVVEAAIRRAIADTEPTIDVLSSAFEQHAETLTSHLGDIFDYETIPGRRFMQLEPDFKALDISQCRRKQCVLVRDEDVLTVVIADPFDQDLRLWVESRFPQSLQWLLTSAGDMKAFIARHERSMNAMDSAISTATSQSGDDPELGDLSLASISQDSSPVVKLVHSTLYDALRAGASDIHMEAGVSALEVRYRIDGVLAHVATVSGRDVAEQVISRIKVMSELDIAERRIPQDGRFKSAYDGRPIDFRVSIMPSSFGEDAVLRVLDKQAVTDQMTELNLDSLGFANDVVKSLRKLSDRPYGMLLVTGPTGSGKTTTLYGAISESNSGLGKIVTIEDPVEYQLPGVLQIPVNEKKGLTFARGLRSILRHDPDKIMVGEIRDPDTAQIAIQSALTGHLVFTTVHANNVFDVLSRFLHMGVDAYSFVSALNGILAQRLLRIICQHCGEDIEPTPEMLAATGESVEVARTFHWRIGGGCSECRGTGYRGRRAVGELLVLDDELREAIIGRVPVRQLKDLARRGGVRFIRTAAIDLVREGLTTIEEVDRVTTMA